MRGPSSPSQLKDTNQPDLPGWRNLPRNVWVLAATSFLRDVASEMLIHLLPLYLANVLALGTGVIGLIEGIAESTASLAKILSGWLSDRWRRRKELTVLGYFLAALAVPLLAVARGAVGIAVARFLDRLGKGIRTAPRDALIADSITPERRGLSFGLHRAADSAGAFLGLLVAIAIVWRIQRGDLLLDSSAFQVVVAWAALPAFLAAAVVLIGVRETRRSPEGASAPPAYPTSSASLPARASELVRGALDQRFGRFLVVILLFTLGNSSDAFLILRAQSLGASVVTVLGMIALYNLVYTLGAGPAGALSDRLDRRHLVVGGWLLYSAVYLGFALAGRSWALWGLYAGYGLYYAMTEGVAKAMVADMVSAERRGTAYGVYNAAVGLTAFPASLIAGLLWQGAGPWSGFGPAAPFYFGGGLALVAGLLMWRWVR